MNSRTLKDKVKHVVYTLVLPIYLWSIGEKTIEDYITNIEEDYELMKKYQRTYTDEQFKNDYPTLSQ